MPDDMRKAFEQHCNVSFFARQRPQDALVIRSGLFGSEHKKIVTQWIASADRHCVFHRRYKSRCCSYRKMLQRIKNAAKPRCDTIQVCLDGISHVAGLPRLLQKRHLVFDQNVVPLCSKAQPPPDVKNVAKPINNALFLIWKGGSG